MSSKEREFGLLMSDIIHVLLPQRFRIRRILVLVLGDSSAGGWEPPPDASRHRYFHYTMTLGHISISTGREYRRLAISSSRTKFENPHMYP